MLMWGGDLRGFGREYLTFGDTRISIDMYVLFGGVCVGWLRWERRIAIGRRSDGVDVTECDTK